MKNCIGIDIGYGYTKSYGPGGEGHIFPTMVHLTSSGKKFTEMKPVAANGQLYLVGEDAQREGNHIDTRTPEFVTSDPWMAVLGHALSLSAHDGSATLVLGVPPGMYSNTHSERIVEAIKAASICPNGRGKYDFRNDIHVIPQGVGIFLRHVQDHGADYEKTVVVIDIGYRTLDLTLFSEGKYVVETTESARYGVSFLLDGIIRAFDKRYQRRLFHKEAIELFRKGSLTRLGVRYELEEPEEVTGYLLKIVSSINGFIENLPLVPDLIIAGGGGIHLLRDRLEGLRHDVYMVRDPEMANAVGYWYFGACVS